MNKFKGAFSDAVSHTDSSDSIQQVQVVLPREALFIPDVIISGGQSGADYGGLLAARSLGIATGGYAPKGFLTERGPRPDLGRVFGLIETDSEDYGIRTEWNISIADVVILISRNFKSPGTVLTKKLAIEWGLAVFEVPCPALPKLENPFIIEDIQTWLGFHKPGVAMIAGNRESKATGIEAWTRQFVTKLFS